MASCYGDLAFGSHGGGNYYYESFEENSGCEETFLGKKILTEDSIGWIENEAMVE